MTFSSKVKNELVKNEYENICCKKCFLYGISIFGKNFSNRLISIQTENEDVALLYRRLIKELCNIDTTVKVTPSGKLYTVEITQKANCIKLLSFFGHNTNETSIKINASMFSCSQCQNAFLAGAFLSCGTVSSPEKDYHLEFIVPYLNLSKSLVTHIQELELNPKVTNRKGYNIVYFKESESIEDCLYIMGAVNSMFELMNIEIVKDIRNSANRKANCETANISKMVNASMEQITAIEKIKANQGIENLPEQLQLMAEIRIENPDSSLQELSQMFDPPVSKSCVNHRLKKLVELSKEL